MGADPIAILDQARRAALSLATRTNAETLKRILAEAQKELNARLAKVDAAATDTFSVRQMQVTLREIEAILDIVKKKLLLHTLEASKASAKGAIGATAKYLSAAEQQFAGIGGAGLGLNTAAVFERAISGTETSVLRRLVSDPNQPGHRGVMDRYGEAVVGAFEEKLQIGMVAGTPWEEVRKQLTAESPFLQGAPAHWAERIVRTETMHAHNRAGFEATKEIDRQTGGRMIRILCATFDNRTGCLPGWVGVSAAMVRAVYRRWYEGPMAEVITEGGRHLPATPNHPMLTRRGWVCAGALCVGDELVCDARVQHPGSARNQDEADGPTPIGEVFDALSVAGNFERRRGRQEDFHGDGMDRNVDVLWPDGVLRVGEFSAIRQPVAEGIFTPTGNQHFCVECGALLGPDARVGALGLSARARAHAELFQSSRDGGLRRAVVASDAFKRFPGAVAFQDACAREIAFARVMLRDLEVSRLRTIASNAVLGEGFGDVATVDVEVCGHLGIGEPAAVQFDRVLDVKISAFSGHVFNLWTGDGYYAAEGAYTANSDSYAVHGQIRRMTEPFQSWFGSYMTPPNRPNDREIVVPHMIEWPIPDNLKPKSNGEVAARWAWEGRKGSPPARPLMSTVPAKEIGKPIEVMSPPESDPLEE